MSDDPRKALSDTIRRVEQLLELMPNAAVKDLRHKIATLRSTLLDTRPPALVLVGRRGSGKSSVVNALFGAKVAQVGHVKAQTGRGTWFDYKGDHGTLSILDTRGLQEEGAPVEADEAPTPLSSILSEVERKTPDLLVFVVRAFDVDSAIGKDLDLLEEILRTVERRHGAAPPIVCVVTHADMLEPRDVDLNGDAPERDEKLEHLRTAERTLEDHVRKRDRVSSLLRATMGVSAYMSFRPDGTPRADGRYRIDDLARALFRVLPEEGRGAFARVAQVRELQEELAQNLTQATAALCAGIAIVPIPLADLVPITSAQVALIAGIAWLSGRPMDTRTATEFLGAMGANVGAAFALREAARGLIKYVFPGAGSAISGAVAFSGTMALGAAASAYFIRGEPIEVARRIFKRRKKD